MSLVKGGFEFFKSFDWKTVMEETICFLVSSGYEEIINQQIFLK